MAAVFLPTDSAVQNVYIRIELATLCRGKAEPCAAAVHFRCSWKICSAVSISEKAAESVVALSHIPPHSWVFTFSSLGSDFHNFIHSKNDKNCTEVPSGGDCYELCYDIIALSMQYLNLVNLIGLI